MLARLGSMSSPSADDPVRIGVSACLLGSEVRYDGQHKRDGFLADELGPLVEWVPVCPEVEVGMGVPREPVRLVRGPRDRTSMLGERSGADWTSRMEAFAEKRAEALARRELAGYVLKSRSPSCGMERVNLYQAAGTRAPVRTGVGLFAAALMRRLPNLPIEEEGRLHDARLRESFIERVFAYHRLRRLWRARWTPGDLAAFHGAHELTLRAHSIEGYRALGRLVAAGKRQPRARLRARYEAAFMTVLRAPATPGRHASVLTHALAQLRGRLDARDRDELLALIEAHRRGRVPLVVPLVLMRHHVRRLAVGSLQAQVYLDPHPKELLLRNRV
jgi:uncharacterized protein YbbK (DUF523 family)/uncharacterized protein YbgA (DUF1722 family)